MPLYTHDCEACTFLGSVGSVDLYIHAGNVEGGTIIRRFSSEPADYGAIEAAQAIKSRVPEYQNAAAMAISRGLWKEEQSDPDCYAALRNAIEACDVLETKYEHPKAVRDRIAEASMILWKIKCELFPGKA